MIQWKLWIAVLGGISVLGYVATLNVQLASERAVVARLDADLATEQAKVKICTGNLAAAIQDKLTDEAASNLTASELVHALSEWVSDTPDGD